MAPPLAGRPDEVSPPAARSPRGGRTGSWNPGTLLLALATLTIVVFALLNVRQLWVYRQPTDAVLWRPTTAGLTAVALAPGQSPNPLRVGDRLVAINGEPVLSPEAVAQRLYAAGIGGDLDYAVVRGRKFLSIPVRVRATRPALGRYAYLEIVGLLYLAIGLFVLDRRRRAPQALRFYLFCLASFVLYCFHYTGKLNAFDQIIFWANEAALLLAPCLLADFALRFQASQAPAAKWSKQMAAPLSALLYLPAAVLGLAQVALATGAVWLPVSLGTTQAVLDRASYVLLAAYFVGAIVLFARASDTPAQRRQARVMTWGTVLAIAPFLALYVVPYLSGNDLPRHAGASVLSLVLVPLAFGYAIWRHHLLEAEVVLRRGVVYTLATAAVVVAYLGVLGLAGVLIHTRLPAWGVYGWLLAIVLTALVFEPVKRWLQERVDRLFYRERYDHRLTLIDFGRQMSAEPSLDRILTLVLERLRQTLSLAGAAVFLTSDGGYVLGRACGLPETGTGDLDFLRRHFERPDAAGTWVLEQPSGAERAWGLPYYVPCRWQGRLVAVLGLGRTVRGEFLTSEDLELVEALARHLAIALENARLYAELRQRAAEYERLKEFSENIVESIHVGVVAVDLDGRVESWNAHMESLSGRPRQRALGRRLADLLGAEFGSEFERAVASGGIWNRSKLPLADTVDPESSPNLGADPPLASTAAPPRANRIVNLAIAPFVTARYERVGHIVLISDVTAEALLEQQLIQADRLRSVGLLAAGVAHEVNTPLAVISSYAQMLAKQTRAGDPSADMLESITRQTFRASEIISNLLNFSRTGSASFAAVELNAVTRDALALVEHPLRSAGIHVICSLHPRPLAVHGDAGKLQQVILNLILNARDAMPSGGTLRVSTGTGVHGGDTAEGSRVWIAVSDTGEGIEEEVRQRIFDPFFTTKSGLRQTRRARPGATMSTGTGLGLAVTYGIVQEHGGAIRVDSVPGQGSEFRVELPWRESEPASVEAVPA